MGELLHFTITWALTSHQRQNVVSCSLALLGGIELSGSVFCLGIFLFLYELSLTARELLPKSRHTLLLVVGC